MEMNNSNKIVPINVEGGIGNRFLYLEQTFALLNFYCNKLQYCNKILAYCIIAIEFWEKCNKGDAIRYFGICRVLQGFFPTQIFLAFLDEKKVGFVR